MPRPDDLKALERTAYRSFFKDGIWDIYLGLMLLGFGVGAAVSRAGIAWGYVLPDVHLAVVAVYALAAAVLIGGKKYITVPRLGAARFGPGRRARLWRSKAVLAASVIVGLAAFLLATTGWLPMESGAAINRAPVIAGANFLIVFALLAYFLDFTRLYAYALIWGVTFPASAVLASRATISTALSLTITSSAGAAVMLVTGLVLLVQFVRGYPIPSEPTSAGRAAANHGDRGS